VEGWEMKALKMREDSMRDETIQADARGRVGLGRKNALYIKKTDEHGNILLIPSTPVPAAQVEDLIMLSKSDMEAFTSRLETPRPKNAAFEKARSKFKAKYK
jgi:hypothetical protein